MLRGLKYNRKTNIIWAHVGVSRQVEVPNLLEIANSTLKDIDILRRPEGRGFPAKG